MISVMWVNIWNLQWASCDLHAIRTSHSWSYYRRSLISPHHVTEEHTPKRPHVTPTGDENQPCDEYPNLDFRPRGAPVPQRTQQKGWVLWFQRVKERFVFHTLESENPTFLMTVPGEKPSLNVFFLFWLPQGVWAMHNIMRWTLVGVC